ncbi:MAG: hypothetical protein WKG52_03290 [Variovorax sp.]
MQFPRLAAALFLLGFALDSTALTIGRPQGAVWIGKPLDVVIPLSLDAAEAGGALCLEAEVLQGDTRIADRNVTVSLEPGPTPSAARMHIRSTVTVDEPVVTVTARAGCEMRSTRSYVLLADVVSDITPPAVAAASPRPLPERHRRLFAAALHHRTGAVDVRPPPHRSHRPGRAMHPHPRHVAQPRPLYRPLHRLRHGALRWRRKHHPIRRRGVVRQPPAERGYSSMRWSQFPWRSRASRPHRN